MAVGSITGIYIYIYAKHVIVCQPQALTYKDMMPVEREMVMECQKMGTHKLKSKWMGIGEGGKETREHLWSWLL